MKLLVISDTDNDLLTVLRHTAAEITVSSFARARDCEPEAYGAVCVLGSSGELLNPRLRDKLERAAGHGVRIFAQYVGAFSEIYSAPPADTTRSRLIYVGQDGDMQIPGLSVGDLLDDESNLMMCPWFQPGSYRPVLVYREHLIAHTHSDLPREQLLEQSRPGLWFCGDSVLMTSFRLDNFNLGRFAPRKAWQSLISYLVNWLTGCVPEFFPEPTVRFGFPAGTDLDSPAGFEKCRREVLENGIGWLERFLVNEGQDGIREGLRHHVRQDGTQEPLQEIRTDCSGEAAGALRFYGLLTEKERPRKEAENLEDFIFRIMTVREGPYAGMMRWTGSAWLVCYQDDVARAILPALLTASFRGDRTRLPEIFRILDFLVATTAKDGCRVSRTDCLSGDEERIFALSREEHGLPSAHYNAYYHAVLLLGYLNGGKPEYLETARKGLETLMAMYPDTKREQSETEEVCRLILALALLFRATGEEKHREMLYRAAKDLQRFRHPFGGYREWDTGYQASCSRESTGECSILSENGDPITDALYSVNWLPIGFAVAYHVTKDPWFDRLWHDICVFFFKTQLRSGDPQLSGAWTRAFDMELEEAYANPHDVGWAANSCETGWTVSEILTGMMLPDLIDPETAVF